MLEWEVESGWLRVERTEGAGNKALFKAIGMVLRRLSFHLQSFRTDAEPG
jgi:hypothetical protein